MRDIKHIAPNKDVRVLYYGIPTPKHTARIKIDADTILLPARFVEGKGHIDLLTATSEKNYHIKFAGIGPLMGKVKLFSQFRNDVDFLGWVNDMQSLYLSVDIAVFPFYNEGFGMVLLEAMSYGLPVISYDYPAAREIITHQKDGLLIPVGDVQSLKRSIDSLMNDYNFRNIIGYNARMTVVDKFNYQQMQNSIFNIINIQ
ncbi:glycosyltransferase family 4 protein [Oscillatoria amoena NRMC-F 0135]|nr:glycosyltransferase family 4 protein [Oscillatoria amoena NRMC-F 0135]